MPTAQGDGNRDAIRDGNRDAISIDSNPLLRLLGKLIASRFRPPRPGSVLGSYDLTANEGRGAVDRRLSEPGVPYMLGSRDATL